MDDLVHRLRCRYPSGPIVDGEPEFGWRDFSGPAPEGAMLPSPIMIEAAKRIDDLEGMLRFLVDNDSINDGSIDKEVVTLLEA